MYQIGDFSQLPHISHIMWDIDGTITDENGRFNQEVAAKIINLALKDVYHSFITGRDVPWVVRNVIKPVTQFVNFPRVNNNLIFFAEVGAIMIEVGPSGEITKRITPEVKDHPLVVDGEIRAKLKQLAYNPENLQLYEGGGIDADHRAIYDAETGDERRGYLVDVRLAPPKLHPYIWNPAKQVCATFEVIRDEDGKVRAFNQDPYVDILRAFLRESRLEGLADVRKATLADFVGVERAATAFSVVPVVKGVRLGKSWAAGKSLEYLWDVKLRRNFALGMIVQRTIAVGDGMSDFDLGRPVFPQPEEHELHKRTLPVVFVGPEDDLPKEEPELLDLMIIQGTAQGDLAYDQSKDVIRLHRAMGARVVSNVLDFLNAWGYFTPFIN